jgi:hypothetical protein
MAKKLILVAMAVALVMVMAASAGNAFAADKSVAKQQQAAKETAVDQELDFGRMGKGLLEAIVYSILGLIVLLIGFKVLDFVTPFSLNKEIAEDDNTAAGVMVAGMMIALGIIIAASIHG